MPLFKYRAFTNKGKKIVGIIDADSFLSAKEQLRNRHVLVSDIVRVEKGSFIRRIPRSFLIDFTRSLKQLLKAGLNLYDSLIILDEEYRNDRFHPVLVYLCDQLKGGASFSVALEKYRKSFSSVYIAMIQAGEESATLPRVFEELLSLLEKEEKLRKKFVSLLFYPAFLSLFCLVVVVVLLLFVIPSMKGLFEERTLHPITQFLFLISDFVIANKLSIFLSVIVTGVAGFSLVCYSKVRSLWEHLLLSIPFLKVFIVESAFSRFCRTASLLLSAGVSILHALRLSRSVFKNRTLEAIIIEAERKVSEGKKLSKELSEISLIPSIIPRLLSLAEETGQMAVMLDNIALICEENLDKRIAQFIALIQPLLLLFLGLIVSIVILSILIPLTDMGSMIEP